MGILMEPKMMGGDTACILNTKQIQILNPTTYYKLKKQTPYALYDPLNPHEMLGTMH